MKKFVCFTLSLLCLTGSAFAANLAVPEMDAAVLGGNGYSIDTPYEYPITLDMPEWASLTSLQEKLEVCQIPEDILSQLTTPALIETVLDYPLAVNVYAHGGADDGIEVGVEVVSGQFNGLVELRRRLSEEPSLTEAALADCLTRASACSAEDFESVYAEDLLTCLLCEAAGQSARINISSVTTPNGSKAPAYNCHSYAWYSDSSSNPYWIDDPSEYVLDGSYGETSEYYIDAIVLYGEPGRNPSHSGIVSGISDRHHLTYVVSKWRYYGLFEHLYYDCPFAGSVHTYRKN